LASEYAYTAAEGEDTRCQRLRKDMRETLGQMMFVDDSNWFSADSQYVTLVELGRPCRFSWPRPTNRSVSTWYKSSAQRMNRGVPVPNMEGWHETEVRESEPRLEQLKQQRRKWPAVVREEATARRGGPRN
jgi:hypothetical protein